MLSFELHGPFVFSVSHSSKNTLKKKKTVCENFLSRCSTDLHKQRGYLFRCVVILRDTLNHFNCIYESWNSIHHGLLERNTQSEFCSGLLLPYISSTPNYRTQDHYERGLPNASASLSLGLSCRAACPTSASELYDSILGKNYH